VRPALLLIASLSLTGASAPDEAISFDINSWGKRIHEWRIEPDGSIHYAHSASNSFQDSEMVTQDIQPSPARYIWLRNLLAPVRNWVDKGLPCTEAFTDAPYGSLRWGEGKELGFNGAFTCKDPTAQHAFELIRQADEQVVKWVDKGPVPPAG
jgi:hypothetical protein